MVLRWARRQCPATLFPTQTSLTMSLDTVLAAPPHLMGANKVGKKLRLYFSLRSTPNEK